MKRNIYIGILLCMFGGFIGVASAQDFSKLDQFLDSIETHNKFMGNVLLAHDGKVLYERSIGYQDILTDEELTNASRFRVGSITKMFTTSLVLKGVEQGKLSLDQPLSDFYPQIENAEKITISNLLQHRSGIHNFTNDEVYMTFYQAPQNEEFMIEKIVAGGSDFEPDSKADYSNSNYVLLTYILEKAYKQSYDNLIKEYITSPLQLNNTYVGKIPEKEEAKSYQFEGDKWIFEPYTDMSVPVGAGAIVSTTTDLAKFIEGLFAGQVITQESLDLMMEIKDGYGRGMFQYPYGDRKSYGHSGGIDGFRSQLSYFPNEKLTVVSLYNALNYNSNDISLAMLHSYFGNEVKIPNFSSVSLSEEELDQYVGEYSSEQIPLVITFVREGNKLIAKPTGQKEAPLEAKGDHRFEFAMVGAIFEFAPEKNEMTLKQGGATIAFKRK
ncbi:serine hydrolase domain-containing protein [Algoriphagus sp. D3-2-R+10]|uniref:serine hydrolase domain-containing protein n=1 Tax=Algoriphagus aurantiacus TaxID=3103948 RepID=UPI002B3857F5|nr:serine hydrolase domain-containing protein [Algoriphagus sp. D3-2-R+10]MEB2773913.1 serine hydrolase domain-containing protein [Algoriphagus sp. D3-2-R+10]